MHYMSEIERVNRVWLVRGQCHLFMRGMECRMVAVQGLLYRAYCTAVQGLRVLFAISDKQQ
jgi:hypothetical protein